MGSVELRIDVRDPERARTIENALDAAADHRDVDVSRGRGPATTGEISRAKALEDLAVAFTGWKP